MKIHIITPPNTVDFRVQEAIAHHPDASLVENIIYLKDKKIAIYEKVIDGVEVTIIEKPWYISQALINQHLNELFA